jgi:hypothetical protein
VAPGVVSAIVRPADRAAHVTPHPRWTARSRAAVAAGNTAWGACGDFGEAGLAISAADGTASRQCCDREQTMQQGRQLVVVTVGPCVTGTVITGGWAGRAAQRYVRETHTTSFTTKFPSLLLAAARLTYWLNSMEQSLSSKADSSCS